MPEPFTMFFVGKWLAAHAAHTAAVHTAAAHTAAAHTAAAHTAAAHTAAAHAGLATILGVPIAASTLGGLTFLNVYKRAVDDVYDEVKKGVRAKPSAQEMREISRVAYERTRAILTEKNILTAADRDEMDSLKTQVDYAFAA